MENKRILVTGGSGFLGMEIVKSLLKQGHFVSILDINPPHLSHANLTFIEGDIRDSRTVGMALDGIDVVEHAVAQVPLAKNKELFSSVNFFGTENLLKNALKKKIKKLVYISSSAVFGIPKFNPVTRETRPTPMEEYGKAKYLAEQLCHSYQKKSLDITIVRPRTIVGPGRLGIFQLLFEWICQGQPIPVLGSGKNIYQFVHTEDVAQACISAGFLSGSNTFNIGADTVETLASTLKHLIQHAQTSSYLVHLPKTPTIWAMKLTSALNLSPLATYHSLMYGNSLFFDTSYEKKMLNYQPNYSNNTLFSETYDWYIKNRTSILHRKQTGSQHQSSLKQRCLKYVPFILKHFF